MPSCDRGPRPGQMPRWALALLLGFAGGQLAVPLVRPSAGSAAAADVVVLPLRIATDDAARARQEHLAALGADRWHAAGIRGRETRLAILDTGFRGYRDYLGRGLPAQVKVRSFRRDGNLEARDSQHGILCGEVIHALAPEAELLLANWEPDAPDSFLAAVAWAVKEGAKIISCSVIMPHWSDGEGGGQVHAALASLLGTGTGRGDPLFIASAGNTALRHWAGPLQPNRDGLHEWSAGKSSNALTPWGGERVAVELYGPATVACELQVHDGTSGEQVARARLLKSGHGGAWWGHAVARFDPLPGRLYSVRLLCPQGTKAAEKFHVTALGGNLEYHAPAGSISFPGDGARVLTVGAVDQVGKRCSYSSCGPNSRLPKPDFVARVPFPSQCRQRPFAGTSAAAPQAAGLAALCWSRFPDWTAAQLRAALQHAALDLAAPGHDFETGYGLLRLP